MEIRVSDMEWEIMQQHLSWDAPAKNPGRPRANARAVIEGILWILVSGSRWKDLPCEYPAKSTCHKYFQRWARDGSLDRIRRALVNDLNRRGLLWLEEGFIDGSFA